MQPETEPQPPAQKRYFCRHIFPAGHRCGAAALRNEPFCYWHHTTRRPVRDRAGQRARNLSKNSFHLEIPEDRSDLQYTIGLVLQRIAANEIDTKRAGLLLYGLQIAALNLQRAEPTRQSEKYSRDSVKQPLKPPARSAEPVEEIITHPELGPLAPETEYLLPVKQKGFAESFMAEWKRHQAQAELQQAETERLAATNPSPANTNPEQPNTDPAQPAILPKIQACQSRNAQPHQKNACHPEAGRLGTPSRSDGVGPEPALSEAEGKDLLLRRCSSSKPKPVMRLFGAEIARHPDPEQSEGERALAFASLARQRAGTLQSTCC